ncbi:MAG: type II toxin-antitoxin system RelE/ParE family toxin [Methylocella sp.]
MVHKLGEPTAEPAYSKPTKRIPAFFFSTGQGNEPVRDWLKDSLTRSERKLVGEDIKTVEYGWPIGMPLCDCLGEGLHEVRTSLPGRIARVLFYVDARQRMVLLHGFIKKSRETSKSDKQIARARKAEHEKGLDNDQG